MNKNKGSFEIAEISSTTKETLVRMLTCDVDQIKGMSTIEFMGVSKFLSYEIIDELVQLGYIVEPQEDIKVSEMNISSRLRNFLHRSGIRYLSQVAAYSQEELLGIRNIGIVLRKELLSVCEKYGVKIWSENDMPPELKKCGLHPNIYGKWYDRGIVEISDLVGKTEKEIEELCENNRDVAIRIGKIIKGNTR